MSATQDPLPSARASRPLLVSRRNQQADKKPRSTNESRFIPPPAAPVPTDVEQMRRMTAAERVKYGYQLMKSMQTSKGSAVFRSTLQRDPYDMHFVEREAAIQAAHRSQILKLSPERSASASRGSGNGVAAASSSGRRSSSWARDSTQRGTYLYNWSSMPQCVPKRYIDPTPGPGSYTPPLYFVGGGAV